MKALPALLTAILLQTSPSSGIAPQAVPGTVRIEMAAHGSDHVLDPPLAAGILRWLDGLWNGGGRQAYHYARDQERRGTSKGLLYYLMKAFWHLVAAGAAGLIAGSAVEKRQLSVAAKNACALIPFLVGLFAPLLGFAIAGLICLTASNNGGSKNTPA